MLDQVPRSHACPYGYSPAGHTQEFQACMAAMVSGLHGSGSNGQYSEFFAHLTSLRSGIISGIFPPTRLESSENEYDLVQMAQSFRPAFAPDSTFAWYGSYGIFCLWVMLPPCALPCAVLEQSNLLPRGLHQHCSRQCSMVRPSVCV